MDVDVAGGLRPAYIYLNGYFHNYTVGSTPSRVKTRSKPKNICVPLPPLPKVSLHLEILLDVLHT